MQFRNIRKFQKIFRNLKKVCLPKRMIFFKKKLLEHFYGSRLNRIEGYKLSRRIGNKKKKLENLN